MEEKMIVKSKKTNAIKRTKIIALVLLLIAITSSVLVIKLRKPYKEYYHAYFSSDLWSEENDYYREKYDIAYAKLTTATVFLCISLSGSVVLGIVYLVLNRSCIIVTNKRILGKTSFGDKFSYSLQDVRSARLTEKKIIVINFKQSAQAITLKHIANCDEIINVLNHKKQALYGVQEQLTDKDIIMYQNVDNISKKENAFWNTIYVGVLLAIIIGIVLLFKSCTSSGNDYSDVFSKDPNTWTDEEKDYVNDFADWFDKNN